jgi:protein associated with RNAse G/E
MYFNKMLQNNNSVLVNSRKMDNQVHRSWSAELIKQNAKLLILFGEFESEIKHRHLGVIRRGTLSYEYYWFDRWFNIFRFHEPDGSLRNFYCNINKPPVFENNTLNYIDLDIDIIVWNDYRCEILDVDEFEENTKKYNYSEQLVKKTKNSLAQLLKLIDNRQFPFNEKFNFDTFNNKN